MQRKQGVRKIPSSVVLLQMKYESMHPQITGVIFKKNIKYNLKQRASMRVPKPGPRYMNLRPPERLSS